MITAWAHTDDWTIVIGHPTYALPPGKEAYAAAIDATPWFEQAGDEAILALVRKEWGGDYEADDIGLFLADKEPRLQELLNYCDVVSKYRDCGWEFYVDHTSAKQWLIRNRPALLPRVIAIEDRL